MSVSACVSAAGLGTHHQCARIRSQSFKVVSNFQMLTLLTTPARDCSCSHPAIDRRRTLHRREVSFPCRGSHIDVDVCVSSLPMAPRVFTPVCGCQRFGEGGWTLGIPGDCLTMQHKPAYLIQTPRQQPNPQACASCMCSAKSNTAAT